MALVDLWNNSPEQLDGKQVQQVIAFAGSGRLRDGVEASAEFREFLSVVPSTVLSRYAEECLTSKFDDSGLALQDVVNEIGRRLEFSVEHGVYRGASNRIGFDGIWKTEDSQAIVVEVKTTDTYRIDLNTIARYRQSLIQTESLPPEGSSMLIVVGRQDTGDLEAQVRGSRQAWDTRLISVDSLVRLMNLKESLEDPDVVRKIRSILAPQEFTRVDGIIDIVFATTEDVRQAEVVDEEEQSDDEAAKKPRFVPAAFHDACVRRIETHLGQPLIKRSRATYTSADGSLAVLCAVSRVHSNESAEWYWYAFHPHQRESLSKARENYVAFGCGSADSVLLIPLADFDQWLDGMNITQKPERFYWHVVIFREVSAFVLRRKRGFDRVELTPYLLPFGEPPTP